jgi:hypothetical protein
MVTYNYSADIWIYIIHITVLLSYVDAFFIQYLLLDARIISGQSSFIINRGGRLLGVTQAYL